MDDDALLDKYNKVKSQNDYLKLKSHRDKAEIARLHVKNSELRQELAERTAQDWSN